MPRLAIKYEYDHENGEGIGVVYTKFFANESALMRLDILKDAIGELETLYAATYAEWASELEKIRRAAMLERATNGISEPEARL